MPISFMEYSKRNLLPYEIKVPEKAGGTPRRDGQGHHRLPAARETTSEPSAMA